MQHLISEPQVGRRYKLKEQLESLPQGTIVRFLKFQDNIPHAWSGPKIYSDQYKYGFEFEGPNFQKHEIWLHFSKFDWVRSILELYDHYSFQDCILEVQNQNGALLYRREFEDKIKQVYCDDDYFYVLLTSTRLKKSDRGFHILPRDLGADTFIDLSPVGEKVRIRWLLFQQQEILALNDYHPNYIYLDREKFNVLRAVDERDW